MYYDIEIGEHPNVTEMTTNRHVHVQVRIDHTVDGHPSYMVYLLIHTIESEDGNGKPSTQFLRGYADFARMGFDIEEYHRITDLKLGETLDCFKELKSASRGVYVMRVA